MKTFINPGHHIGVDYNGPVVKTTFFYFKRASWHDDTLQHHEFCGAGVVCYSSHL